MLYELTSLLELWELPGMRLPGMRLCKDVNIS